MSTFLSYFKDLLKKTFIWLKFKDKKYKIERAYRMIKNMKMNRYIMQFTPEKDLRIFFDGDRTLIMF